MPDTLMDLLYEVKQLPVLQNRLYRTEKEAKACPLGDVSLVQDLRTGLVFNEAFRADLMRYDETYQNEQAVSPVFLKHLESVSRIIARSMENMPLVEIGCGKGFFLEMLLAKGFDVVGCDPAYEGDNPRVIKQYFLPGFGLEFGGLILRHVLEHVQNPIGFLNVLSDANGGRGRVYIEVPCFDWICEHRAWFDIYYEHVNYFRLSDLLRLFGTVYESGSFFGGQYLYLIADLASLRKPRMKPEDRVCFPKDFTTTLFRKIRERSAAVVWGASSKGVIFSLLMQRHGRPIDMVVDINPAKQGKYLPGTGLLVRSPKEALPLLPSEAAIYVMNSNYLQEIRGMTEGIYRYVGVDCE